MMERRWEEKKQKKKERTLKRCQKVEEAMYLMFVYLLTQSKKMN
tara:strand:+ start:557 stop:688 length:132 start_codon:yes stop_codon:yes gene_type:complete